MNTLTLSNLQFRYLYGQLAVQNFNLTCGRGELKCILGGAESGKSSLFKCIAGLYPPTRGSIYINDIRINDVNIKYRNICLVHQDGAFFKGKTLEYNLNYPLIIRKVDRMLAMKQILAAAEMFGLTDYLNEKIKSLSDSLRLRAMLARAYLRNADLVMIDDPLKNFEGEERIGLLEEMIPYLELLRKNSAVLYATSYASDCRRLNVETTILHYGVQAQTGDPNTLEKYPASITAYEMFSPEIVKESTPLIFSEERIYLTLCGERIYLEREKLLNEVFLGKEVLAAYIVDGEELLLPTLRIFDAKSERLIYFPNHMEND